MSSTCKNITTKMNGTTKAAKIGVAIEDGTKPIRVAAIPWIPRDTRITIDKSTVNISLPNRFVILQWTVPFIRQQFVRLQLFRISYSGLG